MKDRPDIPPLRELTEAEFGTIGRIILIWGSHEQDIGTIVNVGYRVPREAAAALVHSLPYGKKVDLACRVLDERNASQFADLAKELDYIRRVFRPERDTLAHGAFGMWADDAWVRAIARERFVIFDDLDALRQRADYARDISLEAAFKLQGAEPRISRPPRPSPPSGRIPDGWRTPA